MGAAISLFDGAAAIKVPFSRFLPVKKCNDLLAIRSDRFVFSTEKNLILSPQTSSAEIKIDLDPQHFGKIDLFDQKFVGHVPSLVDCEALTIQGDVLFENNVSIKGRVVIKNNRKTQAVIREGAVINKNLSFD
jgi:UTP--glucose-1-phosphate uridylyltransferase